MGTLYVVATPIGNLADITDRAREVLRTVATVVAEDTRRSRKLLAVLGSNARIESFHAHSPPGKLSQVIALLDCGDVAYVTDAGTPGVSDPGASWSRRPDAKVIPSRPFPAHRPSPPRSRYRVWRPAARYSSDSCRAAADIGCRRSKAPGGPISLRSYFAPRERSDRPLRSASPISEIARPWSCAAS